MKTFTSCKIYFDNSWRKNHRNPLNRVSDDMLYEWEKWAWGVWVGDEEVKEGERVLVMTKNGRQHLVQLECPSDDDPRKWHSFFLKADYDPHVRHARPPIREMGDMAYFTNYGI